MRSRLVRGALLGLAVLGVASCGDGPGGLPGRSGALSVAPRFANAVSAGIVEVVAVRVRLARPGGGAVVLDTTVVFPANSDEISLTLRAPISGDAEILQASFAMINAVGDTVFRAGPTDVTLRTAGAPAVATPTFQYSGTGANAVGVRFLAPPTIAYFGDTIDFDVEAFDGQSAGIAGTPIGFALADSADTVRARIPNRAEGRVVIGGQRGSVGIRAFTPADLGATHTLLIQPLASAIQAFAGNAQTGEAGAALAAPFTARVIAEDGLGVEGKEVVFSVTAGGGNLSVLVDTTDANGDAQTVLTLGAVPGAQQVTATATGVSGATTTFTATATAGAPAQLAITAEPTDGIAGAALTPLVVEIRDANGFVVTTANNPVTVALETDPSGVNPLGGTLMVAAVNGIATFSDLTLDVAAQGYVLNVTAAGLTSAIGTAFDVVPGAASVLEFQVQPPLTAGSGAPFAVSVRAMDALGNLATPFTGNVSMAIGANPSAGTLGGTLTVAAVAGVATFSDLEIDNLGDGYTLVATASGLGDATSNAFNIEPPGDVNAWINPAGGAWETASNWSRGTVPLGTDTVWIRQSGTYTVTVSTSRTIGKTLVGGSSGVQTLALTGGTLTIADTVQLGGTTELAISGGTVNGPGLLESDGAVVWSGGTFGAGLVLRSTPIGSFTLSGTAGRIINNIRIEILGAGLWTDTQMVGSGGGAVVHVGATGILDIQGNGSLLYNQGGALSVLENLGTVLRSTSPGIATVTANWVNNGSADIETGTLRLGGGGVSTTGIVNVGAGSTLDFSGGTKTLDAGTTITGDGIVLVSGGTLNVEGPWTLLGQVQLTGGTFRYSATGGTVSSLIASGGTLTGNATGFLTVADSMAWSAGTFGTGGGTTHVAAGATFDLRGTATRIFNNYIVEVAGAGTWRDVQTIGAGGGAEFRVLASGTLDVIGDGSMLFNQGGTQARLLNQGSITRHTSAGIATVSLAWDNDGIVDVQTGRLRLSGVGASTSGSLDVADGAEVEFSGGTKSLGGASSVTGAGRVLVTSGNLAASGPWAVTGVVEVSGGSFNYAAATGSVSGLVVSGGALNAAATGLLTVVDSMAWTGGNLGAGGGTTRVGALGTLDIRGTATRIANGHILEVAGAATWRDAQTIGAGGGATLRILAGGVLDIVGDGSFVFNQGGTQARLENQGTITRSGSAGLATVSLAWDNDGVAEVQTGTLRLSGVGASTSGTLDVAAGALVDFAAGTKSLGASSSVSGAGRVLVSGGSLTANGPWAVTGQVEMTGGSLNYAAATGSVSALIITGGALNSAATGLLTVVDSMAWAGGTLGTGGGTTRVGAGGSFDLRGTAGRTMNGHTVEVAGVATWRDAQIINAGGGATIRILAGATMDATGDGSFAFNQGGAQARLINEGSFTRNGSAGTLTVSAAWDNNGVAEVQTGTLELAGVGASTTGSLEVAAGAIADFSGGTKSFGATSTVTGAGTVAVSGSSLTVNGPWAVTGLVQVSSGTLDYSAATGTVSGLVVTGGTLRGAATGLLTVVDSMAWAGGTLGTGGGVTRVQAGGSFDLRGTVGRTFNNYTIEIGGAGTWRDVQVLNSGGGATIHVLSGGTLDILDDGNFAYNQGGATARLVNDGTIVKQAGAGITSVGAAFDNDGLLSIESGTMSFTGGGTAVGGSYEALVGTELRFAGGTHTLDAATTLTAPGTVGVTSGTVTTTGAWALTGALTVSGGTLNYSAAGGGAGTLFLTGGTLGGAVGGVLTVSDSMVWTGGNLTGAGGSVLVADGALFEARGTAGRTMNNMTLEIAGTGVWRDTQVLGSGGNAVLRVAPTGSLDVQGDGSWAYNQGGGVSVLDVQGPLTRSTSAGTAVVSMSVAVAAPIDVQSGTLQFANGGTLAGSVDIAAGATLRLPSGTYTMQPGFSTSGLGDLALAGATLSGLAAADTVPIERATLNAGALNPSAGGTVRVDSLLLWTGGALNGAGTVHLPLDGILMMSGTGGRNLNAGTLFIEGTAVIADAFTMSSGGGAAIHVAPSGVLSFAQPAASTANLSYNLGGGITTLLIEGDLVLSTDASAVTNMSFQMPGQTTVAAGTLNLTGSGTISGVIDNAANVLFNGATYTFTDAANLTGLGDFVIAGGTLNTSAASDTVDFSNLTITGGNLTQTGGFLIGDVVWEGGNLIGTGLTAVLGDLQMNGTAGRNFQNGVLEPRGTATYGGTFVMSTGSGARLRNLGSFDWAGDGTMAYNLGGGNSVFENLGSFVRNAATPANVATIGANFVDTLGSGFNVDGGTLRLSGSSSRIGGSPGLLGILETTAGTFSLQAGTTIGSDGGLLRMTGGTMTADAGATLNIPTFEMTGGTLSHAATLVFADGFAWGGGNITGAGGTTRIDGGTMVVTGAGRTLDAGHLLDVTAFGAVDFGMTGTLSTGGAAIIRNAGLFDLTGPATISYNLGGGASRFENLSGGTLRSSGATTGALNLAVWNAGGALQVTGDSLRLTAGSVTAFNGTATVDGSALVLAGGTFTLDGGLAVGGDGGDLVVRAGVLAVGANTLTVGGDLTTAGTGLLSMTDAASLVEVDGSATFGGASTAGQMTDGLLRLRGDFAQTGVSNSFRATGAHTTRFEGSLAQNILMSGAGSGGASSRFARVQLFNNNLPVTLELQSDVFAGWVEDSTASAQDVIGSAAGALFSVDTAFTLSNTLFDNVRLAITGGGVATLQTLTFQNMDPTVTQLTVSLSPGVTVLMPSATFLTTPTTGYYAEAIQLATGASGTLNVQDGVNPADPGTRYLHTPSGATFPIIIWNGSPLPVP